MNGKAVVGFFAPDYNACPDPTASDCQTIDWDAVAQYTPADLAFVFENKGGTTHAHTGGAFGWLSTGAYPTGNTNYGISYLNDFNSSTASYASTQVIIGSAFKGFDDGVTNGWTYSTTANHTRYIDQRCGQTWLDTFATDSSAWNVVGKPNLPLLQVATWDDYEEATEIETGIDGCLQSISLTVTGTQLSWSPSFGTSYTDSSIHGSENTVAKYRVYASTDFTQFSLVATLPRANGALPHTFDFASLGLAAGSYSVAVEAVGQPSIRNAISQIASVNVP